MHYYQIYGLKVQSNIEFPQLLEWKGPEIECASAIDIFIEVAEALGLNEKNLKPAEQGGIWGNTQDGLWFRNQAGTFLLETADGVSHMYCEKFPDTPMGMVRSFLLGNCIAIIMTQRKKIVLHGSTVAMGDKTVLVCGDSGTGKSTTAMALIGKGGMLLADDISVLDVESDGMVYSYPGFPEQKLCRDAAVDNGFDLDELTYIDENRDKFSVDRRDIFLTEKRKVDAMISLHIVPKDAADDEYVKGIRIKITDGAEKVNAITSRFFLEWLYGYGMVLKPEEMLKCVVLAGQIEILDVTRAQGMDTKEYLVESLIKRIRG